MQRLLIFIGFMAFGTWLIYLVAVSEEGPEQETEIFQGRPNLMIMEDVHHQESKDDQLSLDIKAVRATLDEKSMQTLMDEVTFTLYEAGKSGESAISLQGKAGEAMLNQKQETVELIGNVDLQDGKGRRIFSNKILYNGKLEQMDSPGPVRIVTPNGVQEGASMKYMVKRNRMILARPRFYQ